MKRRMALVVQFSAKSVQKMVVESAKPLSSILGPDISVKKSLVIVLGDEGTNPVEEIFIAPSEPAVLTNEDSGYDEGGDFNELGRRQLLADADVRTVYERDTDEICIYPKSSDFRKWIVGDFEAHGRQFPMVNYSEFQNKCVTDFFQMFFDEHIVSFLVQETNNYAFFKNYPDPQVNSNEIKCFIAMLILSGYNDLPSERMYWKNSLDTRNYLVYNAMRISRFEQILLDEQ
ncbi:hypothetical protein ILUMI_17916 [Ignelater luminosus]|uniref:PiggyBac transposable element-derived protein domain-containing protein n=1 Tax=Ignelater luminosus TaxID=2038154 RepID=A0A8K0CN59_IGNLU|nr:hypothetical protein ILUMI_17916 [Ignelater luminosus]